MDKIEARLIELEVTVKTHLEQWQEFREETTRVHKELTSAVAVVRRRLNGWYYFALGVAATGGIGVGKWLI